MTAATKTPASRKNRGRRSEIEKLLTDKYHVSFTYVPAVSTAEFDIDRSLANQARFQSINEETVTTYQEAALRGDEFPAVIAYRPGRAKEPKLVIIDGNHRLVAHDRAELPIDVYEIDPKTKPQTVFLMTFGFNTRHGERTTEQERLSQALFLMDNGASMSAAAGEMNVKLADLKRAASRAQGDKRAADVGVDMREWDTIIQSSRNRLLSITTDEGFHGAVHLTYVAKLGADEVNELVALLNTSRSAAKQRNIINSETERYQDRIQGNAGGVLAPNARRAATPKARVLTILGMFLGLPDDIETVARSFADAERGDSARRLLDAAKRMEKLALSLDPDVK